MRQLERSVLKTISYADYFNFPLSIDDIYLWLISSKRITKKRIEKISPKPLSSEDLVHRQRLNQLSRDKVTEITNIIDILKKIPTVQLIAVTGSVAIKNPKENDDVDLMIVTSNNTLWITRTIITLIVSLFGKRRYPRTHPDKANHTLCLNLWLEERSLKIPRNKQNLYTAHEVLQTEVLYDRHHFHPKFIQINSWVQKHLANAYFERSKLYSSVSFTHNWNNHTRILSHLIFPFNLVMFVIQYLYMKPKITTETISLSSAYFHKVNFSKKLNRHLRSIE